MANEWTRGDYTVSTDNARLDLNVIHDYLSNKSYWATGRSVETIRRSIEHSVAFGVYRGREQVGFARVVTDYATFAWIADVFILDSFQGKGLGTWLSTKDAHELYRKFGFTELKRPERWMERFDPKMQEKPDYWKSKAEGVSKREKGNG